MIRVLAILCFYTVYRLAAGSWSLNRNACQCPVSQGINQLQSKLDMTCCKD